MKAIRKKQILVAICCSIPLVALAGGADLTWNASPVTDPALLTGYNAYWSSTPIGTAPLPTNKQILGKVTTTSIGNLTAGVKYYFVVTAFGPGGESARSNEVSATIPFAVPGSATGLSAVGTP